MVKKLLVILITLFSVLNLQAIENVCLLIDVSGSVAGQSANRSYNSFSTIKEELKDFLPFYLSKAGTVDIITFTDSILSRKHLSHDNINDVDMIISKILPQKGNSNLINILQGLNEEDLTILISDGLNNINSPGINYEDFLNSSITNKKNLYMLRIDNNDGNITIEQFKNHNKLLSSLRDIDLYNNKISKPETNEIVELPQNDYNKEVVEEYNEKYSTYDYKWIFWLIIGIIILFLIYYIIIYSPYLFSSLGHSWLITDFLNKLINYWLEPKKYNKFIKNIKEGLYSKLPQKYKDNIDYSYDKRKLPQIPSGQWTGKEGNSWYKIDSNTVLSNGMTYGDFCKKYGVNPSKGILYKYGEPDFKKSGFVVKEGKLKYKDFMNLGTRSKIQEAAYEKMGLEKRFYEDGSYNFPFKDDNKLVPHEPASCRSVQLVPIEIHDLFKHSGGISRMNNVKILQSK